MGNHLGMVCHFLLCSIAEIPLEFNKPAIPVQRFGSVKNNHFSSGTFMISACIRNRWVIDENLQRVRRITVFNACIVGDLQCHLVYTRLFIGMGYIDTAFSGPVAQIPIIGNDFTVAVTAAAAAENHRFVH